MEEHSNVLEYACRRGMLSEMLGEYVDFCYGDGTSTEKRSKKGNSRFPNVAGFCRYFGIGESEYETLERTYPEDFDRLRAIFEDEALNSELSPTLVSAYLKKRFGYDRSKESEEKATQLSIVFEHDVLGDGE